MKNRKLISCILAVMLLITAIPIMASAEDLSYIHYGYTKTADTTSASKGHSDYKDGGTGATSTTSVTVDRIKYAAAKTDENYQFGMRLYHTSTTFLCRFDVKWDGQTMTLLSSGHTSAEQATYEYADDAAVKAALTGDGLTIVALQVGTKFTVWTDDGNGCLVKALEVIDTSATVQPQLSFGIQSTVNAGNTVSADCYFFNACDDVEGALDTLGFSFKGGLEPQTEGATLPAGSNGEASYHLTITPWSNKTVIIGKIKYSAAGDTDKVYRQSAVRIYKDGGAFFTRFDIYNDGSSMKLLSSAHSGFGYTYGDAAEAKFSKVGLTIAIVHSGKTFAVWTDDGNGNMVYAGSVESDAEMKIKKIGQGIVNYNSCSTEGDTIEGCIYYFDGTNDIHGALEVLKGTDALGQTYKFDIADYRGETHSHPDATGYVFGGWYSDAALTTPIDAETVSGYAYAKWVDNDVLTVKVQFSNPVVDVNKKTIMRIVTSVDSGDYNEVGFDVSTTNASKTYKDSDYFTQIVSKTEHGQVDFTYAPTVFHETSTKFATVTLYNLKATDTDLNKEFTIKPFWVTPDGTVVYGITRTVTIQDGIDATSAN